MIKSTGILLMIVALGAACKNGDTVDADIAGKIAAKTYAVEDDTNLKLEPKPSGELKPEQLCRLSKGAKLVLEQEPESAGGGNQKVVIASGIPEKCDAAKFKTAYVWESDLLGKKSTRLVVPYLCQYDNLYEPWATCNNTSLAMIMSFRGQKSLGDRGLRLPDALYERFGKTTSIEAIETAALKLGYKATKKKPGTIDDIKSAINEGNPVIVGADFTGSVGHFIVITGYDELGLWVNDPAGKWDQLTTSPRDGYGPRKCNAGYSGKDLRYSYEGMKRAAGSLGLYLVIVSK